MYSIGFQSQQFIIDFILEIAHNNFSLNLRRQRIHNKNILFVLLLSIFFFTLFKIENAFLFIAKKIILQRKQYEAQKLKFIFSIIVCVYIYKSLSLTHTHKPAPKHKWSFCLRIALVQDKMKFGLMDSVREQMSCKLILI